MAHSRVLGLALTLVYVAGLLASCNASTPPSQPAALPDNRAADEAAIRALDLEFAKAAADKDPARTASFYAPNAVLMAPGSAVATGKDVIQKEFAQMMQNPKFSLTFAPTKVEVAHSGDLAYEIGNYQLTFGDSKGKAQTTNAKYVVVWGKQPDGTWKVLVDAPNTSVE